jgi:hypothetical protein
MNECQQSTLIIVIAVLCVIAIIIAIIYCIPPAKPSNQVKSGPQESFTYGTIDSCTGDTKNGVAVYDCSLDNGCAQVSSDNKIFMTIPNRSDVKMYQIRAVVPSSYSGFGENDNVYLTLKGDCQIFELNDGFTETVSISRVPSAWYLVPNSSDLILSPSKTFQLVPALNCNGPDYEIVLFRLDNKIVALNENKNSELTSDLNRLSLRVYNAGLISNMTDPITITDRVHIGVAESKNMYMTSGTLLQPPSGNIDILAASESFVNFSGERLVISNTVFLDMYTMITQWIIEPYGTQPPIPGTGSTGSTGGLDSCLDFHTGIKTDDFFLDGNVPSSNRQKLNEYIVYNCVYKNGKQLCTVGHQTENSIRNLSKAYVKFSIGTAVDASYILSNVNSIGSYNEQMSNPEYAMKNGFTIHMLSYPQSDILNRSSKFYLMGDYENSTGDRTTTYLAMGYGDGRDASISKLDFIKNNYISGANNIPYALDNADQNNTTLYPKPIEFVAKLHPNPIYSPAGTSKAMFEYTDLFVFVSAHNPSMYLKYTPSNGYFLQNDIDESTLAIQFVKDMGLTYYTGTIVDAENRLPISSVSITLGPYTAISDNRGVYSIGIDPTVVDVEQTQAFLSKPGFVDLYFYISSTGSYLPMSKTYQNQTIQCVLSWDGGIRRDMDLLVKSSNYMVSFRETRAYGPSGEVASHNGDSFAENGFALETITIENYGTEKYQFYGFLFDQDKYLGEIENVYAQVYINNTLVFNESISSADRQNYESRYWHICDVLNGAVVPLNRFEYNIPDI